MIQLNILESYYNSAKPIDCPKEIPGIIRPLLFGRSHDLSSLFKYSLSSNRCIKATIN
jgi:hypothetical protein